MVREPTTASNSSFEGDFAPGQVLIGRYRVIALVGQGGMGQVYLADDLVLGQSVALKFLPPHLADREGGLDRFRAEVRLAREVTHPNVARVHDIGEVGGRHFLSMEFVDGEDLASLVRRIGRVPREKAAEISQQVCAGLAEAHRRGVLHRDLKPANVMLDGEGRVKLTDFGLAVTTDEAHAFAGTPQYMAPEQLSGLPADERSEVYALGLLLYELYTGRRALSGRTVDELRREHEEGPPNPPSSVLGEIEPLVDATLTRCLARDPAQRPANVLEVARALPGGDPLAAALARGQTPAPELVAAAQAKGALSPRTALLLSLGSVALFLGFAVLRTWTLDADGISYGKAPAVLDERTREIYAELAGESAPEFEIHWYGADATRLASPAKAAEGERPLDVGVVLRHTRLAPASFAPKSGYVSVSDPAPTSGSAHVVLDASGRLVSWTRWPAQTDVPAAGAEPDWARHFALAGIDAASAVPINADFVPRAFASERRAWEVGGGSLRIHAASLNGRTVQFELLEGDRSPGWVPEAPPSAAFAWVIHVLEAVAAWVAWQNVRRKRAYLSGALVVGAFTLVTHLVLALDVTVPKDAVGFGVAWFPVSAMSFSTAIRVFLFFLALEPFARRHWPGALVAWTRLLERRFGDPAVGREILVGASAGVAIITAFALGAVALGLALPDQRARGMFLSTAGLDNPLAGLCQLLHAWGDTVMFTGIALALLVAFRSFVRRAWAGNALWFGVLLVVTNLDQAPEFMAITSTAVLLATFLTLLTRLGFLSVVAFAAMMAMLSSQPLTLRPRDWYFGNSVLILLLFAAIVVWAHRSAVGARTAAPARG